MLAFWLMGLVLYTLGVVLITLAVAVATTGGLGDQWTHAAL